MVEETWAGDVEEDNDEEDEDDAIFGTLLGVS